MSSSLVSSDRLVSIPDPSEAGNTEGSSLRFRIIPVAIDCSNQCSTWTMSVPAETGTGGSPLGQKSAQQENPKSNFHLCQSRAPCATPRLVAHSWPVVEGFDRTMVVVYTSISSVGLRLGPLVPITISYPSNVPYPTTHLAAHTARITDNFRKMRQHSDPQVVSCSSIFSPIS